MDKYEKRGVFITNGKTVSIDCYDDVNPEMVLPATPDSLEEPLQKNRPDSTKGSVTVASYNCMEITTSNVKRLSLAPCIIDIIIFPCELQCQTIDKRSVAIVGGLHDQMSTKQMKATVPKRISGTIRLPYKR